MKTVEIHFFAPGITMIFKATEERTKTIVDLMLTQSVEATIELQAIKSEEQEPSLHGIENQNVQQETCLLDFRQQGIQDTCQNRS